MLVALVVEQEETTDWPLVTYTSSKLFSSYYQVII
jgi:hypothetical protein